MERSRETFFKLTFHTLICTKQMIPNDDAMMNFAALFHNLKAIQKNPDSELKKTIPESGARSRTRVIFHEESQQQGLRDQRYHRGVAVSNVIYKI
jgi:hypothetical protein